jgi:hypothetical protein
MDTLGRAWRLGQSGSAWGTLLLVSVKLRNFQAGRLVKFTMYLGRGLVHASNLVSLAGLACVIIPRAYSTVRQHAKWVVLWFSSLVRFAIERMVWYVQYVHVNYGLAA